LREHRTAEFLPRVAGREPATLATAIVSDRSDDKIAHHIAGD
jgi:hypothetical protein